MMSVQGPTGKGKKLQIITLGDHMVGKTSILRRFNDGTFSFSTYTTIGIDFVAKDVKIGSDKIPVKIWDTAGQDRFHTITHSFYKQCQGVLLVFDVGSRKSFDSVSKWMNNIQNHSDKGIIKYLIGNKIDTEKREVSGEDAENVAKEYGMNYFETSARLNKNITEVITSLVKEIYTKSGYGEGAGGFGLSPGGPTKISPKSCC
jgi:small GTP-binding protein